MGFWKRLVARIADTLSRSFTLEINAYGTVAGCQEGNIECTGMCLLFGSEIEDKEMLHVNDDCNLC